MKVVIGPYRTWIGPYQIAEALTFWVPKRLHTDDIMRRKPEWVHDFGTWLSQDKHGNDSWLLKLCQWIESKKQRQVYVRIDRYDTWGMDHTLAHIILPMLKQLKATKHGAPLVDDVDVPEGLGLRSYETNEVKSNDWDTDPNHFARWDWVLDEMIFAFECKLDDSWQDKYSSGVMDWDSEPCEYDDSGKPTMYKMKHGPNHTYHCDYEAMTLEQNRISRGFKLFGKYYENLWD